MRVTGTFLDVYAAARDWNNGGEIYGGLPINPVVRREGDRWMLEWSGLNSAESVDFEVSLEAFDNWFYEAYADSNYTPSDADIDDFINACADNSNSDD